MGSWRLSRAGLAGSGGPVLWPWPAEVPRWSLPTSTRSAQPRPWLRSRPSVAGPGASTATSLAMVRSSGSRRPCGGGGGGRDLLHEHPGLVLGGPMEKIPMADWEWIVNINLLGPVRCLRAFLPQMIERGSGYIVNTASFAGLVAHNPLTIPYDTTKHGVVGLSAGLALYLRPKGIGVSVLCPGYVETNLAEHYRFRGMDGVGVGPAQMPDAVVTPEDVAEKVIAAVEAERFLILSQPEHARIWAR